MVDARGGRPLHNYGSGPPERQLSKNPLEIGGANTSCWLPARQECSATIPQRPSCYVSRVTRVEVRCNCYSKDHLIRFHIEGVGVRARGAVDEWGIGFWRLIGAVTTWLRPPHHHHGSCYRPGAMGQYETNEAAKTHPGCPAGYWGWLRNSVRRFVRRSPFTLASESSRQRLRLRSQRPDDLAFA